MENNQLWIQLFSWERYEGHNHNLLEQSRNIVILVFELMSILKVIWLNNYSCLLEERTAFQRISQINFYEWTQIQIDKNQKGLWVKVWNSKLSLELIVENQKWKISLTKYCKFSRNLNIWNWFWDFCSFWGIQNRFWTWPRLRYWVFWFFLNIFDRFFSFFPISYFEVWDFFKILNITNEVLKF